MLYQGQYLLQLLCKPHDMNKRQLWNSYLMKSIMLLLFLFVFYRQIAKTPPPECNFSMVISPLPPLPNHQQEPAHQADKTKRIPPGHGVQSEQRAQPDHRAQPERPAQPAHRAQLDNVQMKERSESLSTNYGNEEITVSKQAPTPIDWGEDLSLHQQNNQLKMENGCLKASEGVRKEERRSSGSRLLLSLSSTDSEVYFTPPTSLEETEKAKSTCKQCIELKRCLSKSEEEVKKLKKKLTTHDYASDNQMTQLKDELLEKEQENSMLNERFQTYHSQSAYYIKQLHIKIQHLELALDTKVIEKNEALKRLDELQQTINQGYSLSCSPHIHLHMHTSPSGVPLSYPSNTSPPSNMFYHHTRWPPQDSVSGTMNPRAWRSYPTTPNVPLHGPSHTMGIHTTQITPEYTVDTMYLNSQTTSLDYNMDRNSRLQEQVLDHNWTLAGSDQGLGHDTRPASYNPAGGLGHDTKPASYNPAGGLGHDTRPASYDPAGGLGHYTRPANYNPAGGLTHDTRTKATLASYDPVGSVQGLGHNSRIQATFMDMGQCIGADLPDGHIGADSPDGHCNSQYLNDTKTQQDVGQISQVNSPQQDPSYYYGSQNNDSIDTFDNMTADSPPFRGPSNDSGYESLLTTSLSHDSIDYTPKARPNVLKMRNNVCETSQ